EVTVITPVSINAKFDCPTPRLDNACAAHAGGTAGGLNSRGHSGLEPANGIGVFRQRIGEGPGTAASIPLAARRTLSRIAGTHGKAGVIAARAVKSHLSSRGCDEHGKRNQQPETDPEPTTRHNGVSLAPPRCDPC